MIARAGCPVIRLVPVGEFTDRRVFGTMRGRIRVAEDFDAPPPPELLDAFEREIPEVVSRPPT